MQRIRMIVAAGLVVGIGLAGGCQPWKQKYQTCNADLENLKGLFDGAQGSLAQCEAEKSQLEMANKQLQDEGRKKGGLEEMGGKYDPASGKITVTLANDVLFDSGKVTLKSASKTQLGRIASIIEEEHANKEVLVIGHTDTDPIKKSGWKDNWQLSTERALAVTRYLIEQGVSAKQIIAGGRGEHHPVGSSKASNRRVEVIVSTR